MVVDVNSDMDGHGGIVTAFCPFCISVNWLVVDRRWKIASEQLMLNSVSRNQPSRSLLLIIHIAASRLHDDGNWYKYTKRRQLVDSVNISPDRAAASSVKKSLVVRYDC